MQYVESWWSWDWMCSVEINKAMLRTPVTDPLGGKSFLKPGPAESQSLSLVKVWVLIKNFWLLAETTVCRNYQSQLSLPRWQSGLLFFHAMCNKHAGFPGCHQCISIRAQLIQSNSSVCLSPGSSLPIALARAIFKAMQASATKVTWKHEVMKH